MTYRLEGKTSNLKRQINGGMSDYKLSELHELVKDPLRQKILMKLGEHNGLTINELIRELKVDDQQVVLSQLEVLGDLISKTAEDEEYSLTEQGVTKKRGGQYRLSEKGKDAVSQMIIYPEIETDYYKQKIDQKFHSPQALRRRKIIYTLIGASGGASVFFFLSMLFTLFSRLAFNAPGFFMGDGLPYAFSLLVLAPAVGAVAGYLGGQRKNLSVLNLNGTRSKTKSFRQRLNFPTAIPDA
jgi:predicted transcriptional regulator